MTGESELVEEMRGTLGKLEEALGASGDAIVWVDGSGKILWCNRRFDALVERPHHETLGAGLAGLLHLEQGGEAVPDESHPAAVALATQRAGTGTYELRKPGGAVVLQVNSAGVSVGEAGASAVLVLRDLSERAKAAQALPLSKDNIRLLLEGVQDYAIFMLDAEGLVESWNIGAIRISGYTAGEILGRSYSCMFTAEDRAAGRPQEGLRRAAASGRHEAEGWRVRKDGSRYWANAIITALRDENGALRGFAKVTRDFTERKKLQDEHRAAKERAEAAYKELEVFSYSVSHDLRSPLRKIDGLSQAVLEDYGDKLDAPGKDFLQRLRQASQALARLIDELLDLAQVARRELHVEEVDLSAVAASIAQSLREDEPARRAVFAIQEGVTAQGDPVLLRDVLENLLGNAWKFTSKHAEARIEFGASRQGGERAYFIRDDGAGFDPAYGDKLFTPFHRLHSTGEFPGTGLGLATVSRIIHRHGGRAWGEGVVEGGAVFFFTLGNQGGSHG